MGGDPQHEQKQGVFRRLADCVGRLAVLKCGRFALCSIGQQPQDALSDWHRSSFAFPG
jgi:hypothetical protein